MKIEEAINLMETLVINNLSELPDEELRRKSVISKQTDIPEDILTVILKRLRDKNKIKLVPSFDFGTGLPNGSGYCLTKTEAVHPLDRAEWSEIKARVRTFQLGDEPEVIYVIKRREDEYMVVMDDAHDITTGKVLHINSADIMSRFGIDIKRCEK